MARINIGLSPFHDPYTAQLDHPHPVGGSDGDWRKFYSLYERPILAFAASHSLNEAECADVLQETMIKMLRVGLPGSIPAKGRFTGFLFHFARCCVVDALRRRGRQEGRHQLTDASGNPADRAQRAGELALVFRALDLLVEKQCFRPRTVSLFKAVTIEQRIRRKWRTNSKPR